MISQTMETGLGLFRTDSLDSLGLMFQILRSGSSASQPFEYPDDVVENAFRPQHLADFARRFAANMLNRQNGPRMPICFIKLKSCSNSFPRLVRSADAATWVGLRLSELTRISCRTLSPEF